MTTEIVTTAKVTASVAEHLAHFCQVWGPGLTATVAVGLTRQQQQPRPGFPAYDQLWAYHAMAWLRTGGRP